MTTDIESTETLTVCVSPSKFGSTLETDISDSDFSILMKENSNKSNILDLIDKKPLMYLGLPKQYQWLIKEIATVLSGKELDIIIALFKIRFNDPMVRLADQFELSRQTISKSFYNGLTLLANYFQHFVYMPSPAEIKLNLPLAFKINYSNVQCILDAFEIEIEKPSNPQAQSRTWSQYKHCNTLKYIVGCTPNGFISYISKGWGGRISDKVLVEISDLIDILPPNAIIMADRGFKEIETLLVSRNIKLLRPPSVFSSRIPTKQEVLESKVIASLRVHIERVIRRIREFRLLKPHSVVSHKHVGYIDQVVLVSYVA
ncbi:DDE superfamily endonuclease domain-containing protein [Phthorimaea operculella]|nr:DDE superfamily endonuclease domain-containing protein [Phthorimaea operculella]